MGMGATNTLDRVLSSVGQFSGAEPSFQSSRDVSLGGVLFGLPALLSSGLLKFTGTHFKLPDGYYKLQTIFIFLAFMALARIKTIEDTRYCSPGELGKIIGMDRCPEAKTLRGKVALLSANDSSSGWGGELSEYWLNSRHEGSGEPGLGENSG